MTGTEANWRQQNLGALHCIEFAASFLINWTGRVVMLIVPVGLIWFAKNLSEIADGDSDAPTSYEDAFQPLWLAEISLLAFFAIVGIGFFAMMTIEASGVYPATSKWKTFFDYNQPFTSLFTNDGFFVNMDIQAQLYMTLNTMQWIICLSVTSYFLPYKLDEDDYVTSWDTVFAPIWAGYGMQYLLILFVFLISGNSDLEEDICLVVLIGSAVMIPIFVTTILMHVKLAGSSMSWMEVFIPMIIESSLLTCVMIVLFGVFINDI